MIKEEEQEDILTKEIESWSKFEYALRKEDRILFTEKLSECQQKEEYSKAFKAKGAYNSNGKPAAVLLLQIVICGNSSHNKFTLIKIVIKTWDTTKLKINVKRSIFLIFV